MNVPTSYVLILSAVLFILGVLGVLVRRNAIVMPVHADLPNLQRQHLGGRCIRQNLRTRRTDIANQLVINLGQTTARRNATRRFQISKPA